MGQHSFHMCLHDGMHDETHWPSALLLQTAVECI